MSLSEKFKTHIKNTNDHCIVFLSGELDLSMAPQFQSIINPLIEQTDRTLVLNLKDLQYIDSTGIGFMISILKARHGRNASFAIEEIPPQIKKLFDMTGITQFINTTTLSGIERKEA